MSFIFRFFSLTVVVIFIVFISSCDYFSSETPDELKYTGTFAGFGRELEEPFGIAEFTGSIYVSDGATGNIHKINDGELTIIGGGLDTPSGIAFDKDGVLYVADTGSHTIKKLNSKGVFEIVAGSESQAGLKDGNSAEALFNGPIGIAIDEQGTVFVTDTYNDRIRMIKDGVVSTLAGAERGSIGGQGLLFDTPTGISIYNDGLLVADTGNRLVKYVSLDGSVQNFAGNGLAQVLDGSLSSSSFIAPTAITVSKTGQIYIADGNSIRVIGRRVFPFVESISADERGYKDGYSLRSSFNRPSGLVVDKLGRLIVADSENSSVRILSSDRSLKNITEKQLKDKTPTAEEFRSASPGRWPYDPPLAKRDIAGTLGEVRGKVSDESDGVWYHNGLDIAGNYGETARFIRDGKVLRPIAAENFNTSRELIRLPSLGYIHIRLGRDQNDRPFGDKRFLFTTGKNGKMINVRVPRGSKFKAGEAIGTLNALNHVHLIAGKSGSEYNALAALVLPGVSDSRIPIIEDAKIYTRDWGEVETTAKDSRIKISESFRIVVRAYDQMDGNPERRKLGVYKLGYAFLDESEKQIGDIKWNISFEKMPSPISVKFVYAKDSHSGATGVTIFNYIVSNQVSGEGYSEGYIETNALVVGNYTLRVFVADYFGNTAQKDIKVELIK